MYRGPSLCPCCSNALFHHPIMEVPLVIWNSCHRISGEWEGASHVRFLTLVAAVYSDWRGESCGGLRWCTTFPSEQRWLLAHLCGHAPHLPLIMPQSSCRTHQAAPKPLIPSNHVLLPAVPREIRCGPTSFQLRVRVGAKDAMTADRVGIARHPNGAYPFVLPNRTAVPCSLLRSTRPLHLPSRCPVSNSSVPYRLRHRWLRSATCTYSGESHLRQGPAPSLVPGRAWPLPAFRRI